MTDKTIYRYVRPDGGVSVSTQMPDCEYTTMHRLIAAEGMVLTDGVTTTSCVDAASADGWSEIPEPENLTAMREGRVEV